MPRKPKKAEAKNQSSENQVADFSAEIEKLIIKINLQTKPKNL